MVESWFGAERKGDVEESVTVRYVFVRWLRCGGVVIFREEGKRRRDRAGR